MNNGASQAADSPAREQEQEKEQEQDLADRSHRRKRQKENDSLSSLLRLTDRLLRTKERRGGMASGVPLE